MEVVVKFIKGLLLSLLSLLLFLSLSIFGLAFTLSRTVLSPDFMLREIGKLDVTSLAREIIEEEYASQLPSEFQFVKEPLYRTLAEQEPQLKGQLGIALYSTYDFLRGKSSTLKISISLESLKSSLKDNVKAAFLQSPPPQFAGVPPAQLGQYFDQYYDQYSAQVPLKLELDQDSIPAEAMAQLTVVRQYVSSFSLYFNLLLGLIVVFILGIVLLHWNVRKCSRELGITFLTYGAFEFAGILILKYFDPVSMLLTDLPASLQVWLPQVFNDFLAPLQMFSLGCLVFGVILVIVSFVYLKREEEI